jgi:iron-sulfur cluster repair protein YtfE (RIC family)
MNGKKLKLTEKKKKELRNHLLKSDNIDFGELTPAQVSVKAVMFIEGLLNADNQNDFFLEEITGIKLSKPADVTPQTLFGRSYDDDIR